MKTKSLKNRLKAVLVAFVSVLLCMGTLAMPAFAQEVVVGTGDNTLGPDAKITKTYEWAEGTQAPAFTFTYNYESIDGAPTIAAQTIAYTDADVSNSSLTATNGKYSVTKDLNIIKDASVFTHAGVYQYKVTESSTGLAAAGITSSNETYTVSVNVINGTNGLEIYQIVITKPVLSPTTQKTEDQKQESAAYTNTYRELAGASLKVSKVVTGQSADKTLDFNYTVTFTQSATTVTDTPITWTKGNETGTFNYSNGTATYSFTLKNDENIVFSGLDAGAKYTVTEGLTSGSQATGQTYNAEYQYYKPTASVVANGGTAQALIGTKGANLSTSQTIGSQTNSADFSNAREDITITGIFTDNLPYILLVVGIIGAGAVYYTMRRRHAA